MARCSPIQAGLSTGLAKGNIQKAKRLPAVGARLSSPTKPKIQSRERLRNVSGRNQLVGKIVEVKISGLFARVALTMGDQQITSIITADAAWEMQLRKGQTAAALVKSTEVMIVRV
ncbi:MAG: TOBE domain-containing protein [Terracidiphilus sp.]|jgi:molybdopterin-binding protein